eukprot:6222070-Amphidinium_carterae.3
MNANAGRVSHPCWERVPGDAVKSIRQVILQERMIRVTLGASCNFECELSRTVFLLYAMLVPSQGRRRSVPPRKQCKGPLQLAPDTGHSDRAYIALGILVARDE